MPTQPIDATNYLAKTNFRGSDKVFGIKVKDRRQHMYVIGMTGTGKTTLLENMVLQDVQAGRGLCVIDPHGEFSERILAQIPAQRAEDVVYFNPVDSEYPIGFNILDVPDLKYKHLVVSDLMGIFTKIWANVWSARMEYIMQNCILALLDTPGTTLLGIPRLLVDKDYRQKIVANVQDPVVRSFWVHEYETWRDQFRNEAIVPIQNKVGQFLNTSFIRNIVGQPKSTLNVPEVMNQGKILLVNVSKGKIGEDNSQLLGAMLITKIQLAAMERVRIHEEERKDFYLYVDEFQNFATDSFASILSEARKYRLNLIIAHQYIGQLVTDVSTKVRDAVFGNVGTMATFRVGSPDAEFLETEFEPEFMGQDLINLPNHHVYIRLMVDGITSRPFSATTLPPLKYETDPTITETITKISREKYARPRKEVEDRITQWSRSLGEEDLEAEDGGGRVAVGGGTAASGPSTNEKGLYESPCWNCGKTATTPFKPDGKRPVYCLQCLHQIEDGKLIPILERMPRVGKAKFGDTLSGLGIEFEGGGGEKTSENIPRGFSDRGQGREQSKVAKGASVMSRVPAVNPHTFLRGIKPREKDIARPFIPVARNDARPPMTSRVSRESTGRERPFKKPMQDQDRDRDNRVPRPPRFDERRVGENKNFNTRGGNSFSENRISQKPPIRQSELVVRSFAGIKPMSLAGLKPREKKEGVSVKPQNVSGLKELLADVIKTKNEALNEGLKEEQEKKEEAVMPEQNIAAATGVSMPQEQEEIKMSEQNIVAATDVSAPQEEKVKSSEKAEIENQISVEKSGKVIEPGEAVKF